LDWDGIESFAGGKYLNGFYITKDCKTKRDLKTQHAKHHRFGISSHDDGFLITFKEHRLKIRTPGLTEFEQNLLLKLILNIHSTLVMGILARFESNLMTYVKPTNYKLIDRTIRYVQRLTTLAGNPPVPYAKVAKKLFELRDSLSADEPIVLRVLHALSHQ